MAKSTNLEMNELKSGKIKSLNALCSRLLQSKINCTGDCSSVKPSICIDPNGETLEFSEVAWLVDGFQ